MQKPPEFKRRAAQIIPQNRFETTHHVPDYTDLEYDDSLQLAERNIPTQFIVDRAKSILTQNDSPDLGFGYSVNSYRGCEHGCSYCYARPTHETLGMNAGIDFEAKIMVKIDAPKLLRKELAKKSWQPAPIFMSGVTDCYQPAERRFRLTRGCLEVLLEARNPCVIISKNVLMLRDLDLLKEMAARSLVHIYSTITTLDLELAKVMEPRTAAPEARLKMVKTLSENNIPVGVMMGPVIPGLTDHEIPKIIAAAKEAGAKAMVHTILRLPLNVKPIFLDWLDRHQPLRAKHVLARIRDVRGGALNQTQFGERMRGTGVYAGQIHNTFAIFQRKYGIDGRLPRLDISHFRRPGEIQQQRGLFADCDDFLN